MRLFLVSLAILAVTACAQETAQITQDTPSQSTTMSHTDHAGAPSSTMNPVIAPETDVPGSAPTAAGPTQQVHLIEYQIHMPDTLPAGRIGFNIENGGKEQHAFEIEGNGIEQKTEVLPRGNSAALEVDLKPGTYTVYCPVPGHAEKGMRKTVTVQ